MEMYAVKKGNYIETQIMKEILENNDINCLVKSQNGEGFVISTGSLTEEYTLYVMPEDVREAENILESFT